MPSVSKAQHGFMGLVRSVKEGERKLSDVKSPKKVAAAAKSMSREQLREYTATRTGGLPQHAKGTQHDGKPRGGPERLMADKSKDTSKSDRLRSEQSGGDRPSGPAWKTAPTQDSGVSWKPWRTVPLQRGGSGLAKGGPVPGKGSKDTVRARLTPGEFVVNKSAAKTHAAKLRAMNRPKGTAMPVARMRNARSA